jgi:hypothetical protein
LSPLTRLDFVEPPSPASGRGLSTEAIKRISYGPVRWDRITRDGLAPFSPGAAPIARRVRAIRPSIVLEPGTLALFVAGDVVLDAAIGHAGRSGSIARALQVAADRIAKHLGGGASGIVVDLHIAADVIRSHNGGQSAAPGIVVDLHIAADHAVASTAPPEL